MKKEMLNEEELRKVNGALIFNATYIIGSDPARPWEVIDNYNGNVLARFATQAEAVANAAQYGPNPYNTMEVDWNTVQNLRNCPLG